MIELTEKEEGNFQKYRTLCTQRCILEKKRDDADNPQDVKKYQWQIKATDTGIQRVLGLLPC